MTSLRQSVIRPDEILRDLEWPAPNEITNPSMGGDACLVMCAGFEERSVCTLRRVCESGLTGCGIILVVYLPNYEDNRVDEVRAICRDAKMHITEIVYDRREPAGIGSRLQEATGSYGRVFLDISGMSRLLIVQAVVSLLDANRPPVSIVYGEAGRYGPSREQFERDQRGRTDGLTTYGYLSSGIFEIAAAAELSSVSMVGQAIRLVAFPSFDPSQLTNLIQELQPTFVESVFGIRSSPENEWRTEAICKLNEPSLREISRTAREDRYASTLDYRETIGELLEIYNKHSMFDRLVVAPTGSKMQSVAVGLFRRILHDIQIVYPTPKTFARPEDYTVGLRRLYQLDIPANALWSE